MAADLQLHMFMHPSMQVPFRWDPQVFPFKISADKQVYSLMEEAENLFEQAAAQDGKRVQMQINVIWNIKEPRKAVNPSERIGDNFGNGDVFGIYGDVQMAPVARPAIPEDKKIPVTILTGFLGSGKTTLLNHILKEQREKKIAVIENEFGEVSIDNHLLTDQKLDLAEKVIVMDNGCICCTIRGDLIRGFQNILDSVHKGSKIDAIVVETTGMADPVPIVRTFMANPDVTEELRLDGVICVADAKHLVARLDDKIEEGKVNEAYQQVAFSDKVLLNKIDLVSTDEAIGVKERIRSINKFAKVVPTVKGKVRMVELHNMRAHDIKYFVEADIEKEAENVELVEHGSGDAPEQGHGDHGDANDGGHGGGHGHGGHGNTERYEGHGSGGAAGHDEGPDKKKSRHDSRVNSFAITREGEILTAGLSKWMQTLGQLPPEKGQIFRIKAILAVKGHPYKHVFHAVMDVSDEDDAGLWGVGEKRISKIVFIGKGLDKKFLTDGFHDIFEK